MTTEESFLQAIRDEPGDGGNFFNRPMPEGGAVAWVERLNLWNLSPRQVGQLADYPHLTSLTMLDLRYNRLGDLIVALLARSASLGPLHWLDLSGNGIG